MAVAAGPRFDSNWGATVAVAGSRTGHLGGSSYDPPHLRGARPDLRAFAPPPPDRRSERRTAAPPRRRDHAERRSEHYRRDTRSSHRRRSSSDVDSHRSRDRSVTVVSSRSRRPRSRSRRREHTPSPDALDPHRVPVITAPPLVVSEPLPHEIEASTQLSIPAGQPASASPLALAPPLPDDLPDWGDAQHRGDYHSPGPAMLTSGETGDAEGRRRADTRIRPDRDRSRRRRRATPPTAFSALEALAGVQPSAVTALFDNLRAPLSASVSEFVEVMPELIREAFKSGLTHLNERLSPWEISKLAKGCTLLWSQQNLAADFGVAPPSVATQGPSAGLPSAPPPGSSTVVSTLPVGSAGVQHMTFHLEPPPPSTRLRYSTLLSQTRAGEFEPLTEGQVKSLRMRILREDGRKADEDVEASPAQLSALYWCIQTGGVPFVDFAIWTPYNNRLQVARSFDAWVYEAGSWCLRKLFGPSSFQTWAPGYLVWEYAMRAIGAARQGPLRAYMKHIHTLSVRFPAYWGVISVADTVMRSERWSRMRSDMLDDAAEGRAPRGWSQDSPWDAIIIASIEDDKYWARTVSEPILHKPRVADAERAAALAHTGGVLSLPPELSPFCHSGLSPAPSGLGTPFPPPPPPHREPKGPSAKQLKQAAAKAAAAQAKANKAAGAYKGDVNALRPDGRRRVTPAGVQYCFLYQSSACSEPCSRKQVHHFELCPQVHRTVICPTASDAVKAAISASFSKIAAAAAARIAKK